MATEAFVIAITTTGTREVQRDLSSIGSSGQAAAKDIDAVGAASVRTAKHLDALRGSLGAMRNLLVAFSFVRAISGLAEFASTAVLMENKLTTITRSGAETQAVMKALGETSIRTRTDLDTNVDTFVRLARSTGSLKLTYQQLIDLTRGIADTVHIAGASSTQAKRALMDFAEGLAAGSLQGRQLRAMVMQLPTLGDAIAKSFGLAGSQLMSFLKIHPGALSPDKIVKALQAALPGLDATIGKTEVTVGQAFTNMQTKALIFYQGLDKVYGISQKVSDVLGYVGDHISAIGKFILVIAGIAGLGIALSLIGALLTDFGFLYSVVNILTGGLLKLAVALVLLPFRAVMAAVSLLSVVFSALGAVVEGLKIAFFTFQAAITAVQATLTLLSSAEIVALMILSLGEAVSAFFATVVAMLPALALLAVSLGALGIAAYAAGTSIVGFLLPLAQLGTLADPLEGLNLSIKDIPAVFEAAFNTIVENFPLVTQALSAIFDDMISGMKNHFAAFVNDSIIGLPASLPAAVRNFFMVSQPGDEKNAQFLKSGYPTNTAGTKIAALRDKFSANLLKGLGLRGAEDDGAAAKANTDLLGGTPVVAHGKPLDENALKPGQLEAAQQALQNFLKQFSPYAAALAQIDDFNKLVAKSTKSHVNVLKELSLAGIHANSIEDARAKLLVLVQRNVIGVGNAELKAVQETELLNAARTKGIITANEYADALLKIDKARLAATPSDQALGIKVAKEGSDQSLRNQGDIAESVVSKALSFQQSPDMAVAQIKALNAALEDGTIKAEGYAHAMIDVLSGQRDIGSGELAAKFIAQESMLDQGKIAMEALAGVYDKFNAGSKFAIQMQAINDAMAKNPALVAEGTAAIRDLQVQLLSTQNDALSGFQRGMLDSQKTLNDFATTASTTVTSAFNDLQDALVQFFDTGKINVKKFADDILANLTKLAVQESITGPLANALGFDQSGVGGAAGTGGILSQIFGGTGLAGVLGAGTGQLGSSAANPMFVTFAQDGSLVSSLTGGGGGNSAGLPGAAGGGDLFSNGGIFSGTGFFANLFGGTGGGAGSASSGILSALSDIGGFLGFAGGGDMVVGGQGGTDSQNINFKATPGEIVSVRRPGDASSTDGASGPPINVQFHVHGVQDVDGFQRSSGQLVASLGAQLTRTMQRNGKG